MLKVSILIPCHNAGQFVASAIQSALDQTYPNTEVIVVDDGSTDDSLDKLSPFVDRITIESNENRGACAARNRAFELSSGEYIQYLDADDKLSPIKVERQLPLLLDGRADVALCKIGLFGDNKGERAEKRQHPEPTGDPLTYFVNFPIQTAAPLMHRRWVERAGGFKEGLKRGQEADFHRRVAASNPRLAMVDEILVWVRMHDGPRVTHRPSDPTQTVEIWQDLASVIERENAWTTERRAIVARTLLNASRSLFADGDRGLATAGIQHSVAIDSGVLADDSAPRRILNRLLGPVRAEHCIRALR